MQVIKLTNIEWSPNGYREPKMTSIRNLPKNLTIKTTATHGEYHDMLWDIYGFYVDEFLWEIIEEEEINTDDLEF